MSSAIVKNLSDFFKLLVQSFNLSNTFPALVLVILTRLFVWPSLAERTALQPPASWDGVSSAGTIALLVMLLAYVLDAANRPIIRLFEGYWFRDQWPFNRWRRRNQKHVRETWGSIRDLERRIDRLIEQGKREHREGPLREAKELLRRKAALIREVADKYPDDPEYVLCSPFGNVIAAAERYPKKVLDMDAKALWPFLLPTLTESDYAQVIAREKGVRDFCVNLTLVVGAFGCMLGLSKWWLTSFSWALVAELAFVLLSVSLLFLLSVQGAAGWGAAVRAAFVIFRAELRQTLHLRRPKSYEDERRLWSSASSLFRGQSSHDARCRWGEFAFDETSYQEAGSDKEAQDEAEK